MDYDIGTLNTEFLHSDVVNEIIQRGHEKFPPSFPRDRNNEPFPNSLLSKILPNGETVKRDWLVWSSSKDAFYCLPCRLLSTNTLSRSNLCRPEGFSKHQVWKKLYYKLPAHESNRDHVLSYVQWRSLQIRIRKEISVDLLLNEQIISEKKNGRKFYIEFWTRFYFLVKAD